MKRIIVTCSLLGVIVFAGCQHKPSEEVNAQPNILFIAIDDMNDWTGFLDGHPQSITPNLDKLADIGVNFTNAHCPAPGCSPSRNALLYGVEPFNSGLYPFYGPEIHEQLMEDYTSLPRLFKENGYETISIGKIFHHPADSLDGWTVAPWRAARCGYWTARLRPC